MSAKKSICGLLILSLAACATPPMGPTVQVMPSPSKPFQVFLKDQEECKQYAQSQVAGQAEVANQQMVGTVLAGAALGAALGNAAFRPDNGAAVGASSGAITGTAIGANRAQNSQDAIQEQYNNAYVQCMYSKGNQVPGAATQASAPIPAAAVPQSVGAAGMSVQEAQARLNALGYPVGSADGVMGKRTHQQIKHFQRDRGLTPSGDLDAQTVAALGAN